MIIAFLQLREPPVVPALHQRHNLKQLKKDGTRSEFADDISKLRGFGSKNKDSLAALLFQFFRFYAHEFDYDKYALSIRMGKLLTKVEKKWHIGSNNALCIEEPFNTVRNLGNTADDTSFRGLHLELRRAFDLISEGKFEECCEQYVFPKEEERVWQKPAPAPRPVLLRSSSQQQHGGGRGGRGGYRGNRQFHRNGNAGRRSSSSVAYEPNPAFTTTGIPATMSAQDLVWYQTQNPQLGVPQEVLTSPFHALAAQETMRFQLYTQLNQQQVLAHAQRVQQSGSAADRSRTNSLDTQPMTAPIRPPDVVYTFNGLPFHHSPYFHTGFTTYPSSPASTAPSANGQPEFRRSLHRNTAPSDSGPSPGSGALRSQSQPASRSPMTASQSMAGYSASSQSHNGVAAMQPRQANGMPVPSFIPDEAGDGEFDDVPKVLSDSPPEDDGPRYIGYYVNDHTSPNRPGNNNLPTIGVPLGDSSQSSQGRRRRLSTDQLPQSVLDRRMKRTSRSPSPMGHARAMSVGINSAPVLSAHFSQGNGKPSSKPLVVNGTVSHPGSTPTSGRPPLVAESTASEDVNHESPLHIHQGVPSTHDSWQDQQIPYSSSVETFAPPASDRPVIVNGSSTNRSPGVPHLMDASFQHRVAMGAPFHLPYATVAGDPSGMAGFSRIHTRQQLAPLDLATGEYAAHQELPHLSPVYEQRTPSPTVSRKFDSPGSAQSSGLGSLKEVRTEFPKPAVKTPAVKPPAGHSVKQSDTVTRSPVQDQRINGLAKENGHVRAAKSQTESFSSGWQKTKSRKKGPADSKYGASGSGQSEQPKNEADRKGG